MAGMGAGYDLSVSTFSPDGRVFQVEYAAKAVDNSGTVVAVVCKDGVVFGVEKYILNRMLTPGTNRRIFAIDRHVGMAVAGLVPDARQVVKRARAEAASYRRTFGEEIQPHVLAERVGLFIHAYTLYWSVRPFGASILIGAMDTDKNQGALYCIEPSGTCYQYVGNAIGKARQSAKTELEKMNLATMTCSEAVMKLSRILHCIHDESKEKQMEVELAWICPASGGEFQFVPDALIVEAKKAALEFMEVMDTD